jgi:hypothetical protein
MVTGELDHAPRKPLWSCRGCERPWPCLGAQVELLATYEGMPLSLSLYLAASWVDLLTDFARIYASDEPDARETWERVVGWAVPALRGTRRDGPRND